MEYVLFRLIKILCFFNRCNVLFISWLVECIGIVMFFCVVWLRSCCIDWIRLLCVCGFFVKICVIIGIGISGIILVICDISVLFSLVIEFLLLWKLFRYIGWLKLIVMVLKFLKWLCKIWLSSCMVFFVSVFSGGWNFFLFVIEVWVSIWFLIIWL